MHPIHQHRYASNTVPTAPKRYSCFHQPRACLLPEAQEIRDVSIPSRLCTCSAFEALSLAPCLFYASRLTLCLATYHASLTVSSYSQCVRRKSGVDSYTLYFMRIYVIHSLECTCNACKRYWDAQSHKISEAKQLCPPSLPAALEQIERKNSKIMYDPKLGALGLAQVRESRLACVCHICPIACHCLSNRNDLRNRGASQSVLCATTSRHVYVTLHETDISISLACI
jgi:hypothetical protein